MTVEEMKARIAELEEENARLKGYHKKRRSRVPTAWLALHPIMDPKYGGDANTIGSYIRRTLFPETIKDETFTSAGRFMKRNVCISVDDMTDDQYAVYMETFENVLEAVLAGKNKIAEGGAA